MLELHRVATTPLHTLVDDPATADMILFVGGWKPHGEGVVNHPLPRAYPDKCFLYVEDDGFVPLFPGIYTNAEKPRLFSLGRTESFSFSQCLNPHTEPMPGTPKQYLFSFAGGSTSMLRKKMYKVNYAREDVLVLNTSDYFHWDFTQSGRAARQQQYAKTIAASHFGLCPRGASSSGMRLFEVMKMGVAPVILSDRYPLPPGPDWASFAITVPERKIKDLPAILEKHVGESAERGRLARLAWEQYFAPEVMFNGIIAGCVRILERRKFSERWIHPFWPYMLWRRRLYGSSRGALKNVVLWVFRVLRLRFIYQMNER